MRAAAQQNRDHLFIVARAVVSEDGAEASLRDVARRAEVRLGTLYRHSPTREALLEALPRASFDGSAARAAELETSSSARDALVSRLRDCAAVAYEHQRVVAPVMAVIEDPGSALHASCVTMRAAGARLLSRARAGGEARSDIDGTDLFAFVGALAWLSDQPSLAPRSDHLSDLIANATLTSRASEATHRVMAILG